MIPEMRENGIELILILLSFFLSLFPAAQQWFHGAIFNTAQKHDYKFNHACISTIQINYLNWIN